MLRVLPRAIPAFRTKTEGGGGGGGGAARDCMALAANERFYAVTFHERARASLAIPPPFSWQHFKYSPSRSPNSTREFKNTHKQDKNPTSSLISFLPPPRSILSKQEWHFNPFWVRLTCHFPTVAINLLNAYLFVANAYAKSGLNADIWVIHDKIPIARNEKGVSLSLGLSGSIFSFVLNTSFFFSISISFVSFFFSLSLSLVFVRLFCLIVHFPEYQSWYLRQFNIPVVIHHLSLLYCCHNCCSNDLFPFFFFFFVLSFIHLFCFV